ncbi:hypothetical protein [Streptomyces sp. cmx-4-7]|uniref:hypothetical protein n=1 Tax=Streptomyces sp. cmx-4-7 TaxID=2790939 RepID=UPI00398132D4
MRHWKTLLLAAALTLSAAVPSAAAPPGVPAPDCAWKPLGYRTSNVAFPDTNAQYWLLHYTVREGLRITLDGRFPDARYASFASYDATRGSFTGPDGKPSVLTDHHIVPDPGSRNPFLRDARPGGKYTVTVSDNAAHRNNVLPLAPAGAAEGSAGTVIHRLYLPHGGEVELPKVTFELGGHRVRVPTCDDALTSAPPASPAPTSEARAARAVTGATVTAPARPAFARTAGTGLYPNPDNAYLSTGFEAPAPGQVLLVRGKAPTATAGDRAQPWPGRGKAQVRYWSLCDNLWWGPGEVVVNPLPDGTVDPGCRADFDTRLAADGSYTYAVGTEEQRATVEGVPGVTFLPLSAATPTAEHLLILRNMVDGPGFDGAIQRVPVGSDPARTAEIMGAHYPRTGYCALSTLTSSGPDGCPVA